MATLTKVASGNMYVDDFNSLNLLWEITPNDNSRVVLSNGTVYLKHGDERISMLTSAPSGDYVFQANIKHQPEALSDVGGIIVLADNQNSIECQTFHDRFDSANQYYKSLKMVRTNDVHTFYGTKDSKSWEIIGASEILDGHKVGFFLDGVQTSISKDFEIFNIAMYKANFITILNVPSGLYLKILDNMNNVIMEKELESANNKCIIDMTNIMLPIEEGSIKLYDSNGNLVIGEKSLDIFGGDVYDYSIKVVVTIDGRVIEPAMAYNLGHIGIGGNEFKLTIINKDNASLQGRKLSIVAYSEFFRGGKFAQLALEDSNGSIQDYSYKVDLPSIHPNQSVFAWMKIERDVSSEAPFFAKEYKFKVVIE